MGESDYAARMAALGDGSPSDLTKSQRSFREKARLGEVTYKETKDYLLSTGMTLDELGTKNKFYLREVAIMKGIDLTPLLKGVEAAEAASAEAKENAEEATRLKAEGATRHRRASIAADEARAKASQDKEEADKAAAEQAKLQAEAEALKAQQLAQEEERKKQEAIAAAAAEESERKAAEEAAKAAEEEARRLKEEEEAKALAEKAAAEEAARLQAEAEAAAEKARLEEEERKRAEEEMAALKAAEEAAERERIRAEEEAAAAQRALEEARAAEKLQAAARGFLQKRVYYKAWKSVVTLQKLHRGRVIKAIVKQLLTAGSILKSGNIFLKFSKDGPPHDRLVWISDDLKTLKWCAPEKNRTHELKPDAQVNLNDISAVTEGVKTELFKASVRARDDGTRKMSMLNAFKKDASVVVKKGEAISDLCCFSVIAQTRTIDLVAPSNRVRDDWLWALRLMLVHRNTKSDLKDVATQRRLVGETKTSAGLHTATSLLSDEYVTCEYEVPRTSMGMGIIMDSASNVIVELEPDGTGVKAGLKVGDLVTVVDSVVVTVIEDGMIVPRSAVNAAIDPTKQVIHITVFRPAHPVDPKEALKGALKEDSFKAED